MRHQKSGRTLSRRKDHRKALLANLVVSLIKSGKIKTTDSKAKEVRPFVERMVTFAKRGDLHARRIVLSRIGDADAVKKLFEEIGPQYVNRFGGYTRIIKLGFRQGDNSPVSLIEFVKEDEAKKTTPKRKSSKAKTKPSKKTEVKAEETVIEESTVEETSQEETTEEIAGETVTEETEAEETAVETVEAIVGTEETEEKISSEEQEIKAEKVTEVVEEVPEEKAENEEEAADAKEESANDKNEENK